MMSLTTIREVQREAARIAAAANKTPHVYFRTSDVVDDGPFPFPFLGDYVPYGWTEINTHLVDSSGFGSEDEPALTQLQLVNYITHRLEEEAAKGADGDTLGWAVSEAGQFQVVVTEYRREK